MSNLFKVTSKCKPVYKQTSVILTRSVTNRLYSTEQAIKTLDENEHNKQLLKDFEIITNINTKKKVKKPQKPPFLKNIFLGNYDTDMLTFPELEKDELETLTKKLQSTEECFKNEWVLNKPPATNSDFMENLKRHKLFGLQGPQTLGARGLDVTENCRFDDVLSKNTSAFMGLLCNDKLVFQTILKHGSEVMKKKYLPQLISGDSIGAFCVIESGNIKEGLFNTTAKQSADKKSWVLNGEKLSVVNGNLANILLVLAKTEFRNRLGLIESQLTLFVVEKDFGGVTTQISEAMGLQATDFATVTFNNTHIPEENILGLLNQAHIILPSILTNFRIATGSACAGILRNLIDKTVKYCTDTTIDKRSIAETDYVQSVVGQLTVDLYAIESINYLTSFMMDQYEDQDCQMEALAVKIFSSQQTSLLTLKVMEMIGPVAYMKDHWCNALHRDALSYLTLYEPSENLKLTLSLLGLEYTGKNLQEKVKKLRNPLFHPVDAFKQMWYKRKQIDGNPELTLNFPDYLHPSLIQTAQLLEFSVLRFEYAVESLLIRLGNEVINNHMDLLRLADCLLDIYAMTACLGRASRAYCIGLAHAEMEMVLANAFCVTAVERVREKLNKICGAPFFVNDEYYKKIAENLFKMKGYFPVHPLTRNY